MRLIAKRVFMDPDYLLPADAIREVQRIRTFEEQETDGPDYDVVRRPRVVRAAGVHIRVLAVLIRRQED